MKEPQVTGIGPKDPVPPEGYPFQLTDTELDAVLRDMLAATPGFDEYRAILPELKPQLIVVGFQERPTNADRFARRSLTLAFIASAVAVISVVVSIILAV